MKEIRSPFSPIPLWLLVMIATACSPKAGPAAHAPSGPPPTKSSGREVFANPFAYCAAVRTVDAPDSGYAGVPIPDAIISGFKKAAGLEASTESMATFRRTTIWRCMNGKVYACNFGANLPCDSKAKTDRTPSPSMQDYCRANPNSAVMPMSATGHDTIYSWQCVKGQAQLLAQIGQVDAAGYLAQIWYAIEPGP